MIPLEDHQGMPLHAALRASSDLGGRLIRTSLEEQAARLSAVPGPPMSYHLDRAITDAVQENEMNTDELTDRSLDGRGDERARCPSTLHANGEHGRCSGDRGHTDKHHSERLAAIWSRDEPMVATLAPAGPEWEEFKAWKAAKERKELIDRTRENVDQLVADADTPVLFHDALRQIIDMANAGTIDLSIYDEGKSE